MTLNDLGYFRSTIIGHLADFDIIDIGARIRAGTPTVKEPVFAESLFCPSCGDNRRVRVTPTEGTISALQEYHSAISQLKAKAYPVAALNALPPLKITFDQDELIAWNRLLSPATFVLQCAQCQGKFTALLYEAPGGQALAILPAARGGLRTPHPPEGVAYYLDQAERARSVNAASAAVAMYRGALEHLLYDQGLKNGMLGQKISELEKLIAAGGAPKWATDLEREFLDLIKELGNGAIHPNDGDIKKQAVFDNEFLADLAQVFVHLLILVYEVPHETAVRLGKLRSRASSLKK